MSNRPAKEIVLDLNKHIDQRVSVKFQGGREVQGVLKGYDQLVNLVLDEAVETLRDPDDPYRLTTETRRLGLVVLRGTQLSLIAPCDGTEEIANPFVAAEEN